MKNRQHNFDHIRNLDLPTLLLSQGAVEAGTRAGYRTRKFKLGNGKNIAVTGALWVDNSTGQGGRGAIDLTMHLLDCPLLEAVCFLSGSGASARVVAATSAPAPATLPPPVTSNWPRAKRYLVEVRKIPAELVQEVHVAGLLYADVRANLVFVRQGGGCFRRGSYDPAGKPAFKQTLGQNAGPFILPSQDGQVFVGEGPIDALALKVMNPASTVLATGGNFPVSRLLPCLAGAVRVFLAHDADAAGDTQAQRIATALAGAGVVVIRHRPPLKDWAAALAHFSFLPGNAPKAPAYFADVLSKMET